MNSVILLYHRVGVHHPDPHGLSVSPERFEQHLGVLRRSHDVVPLGEWSSAVSHVAVTFDDGYADNAGAAIEMLEAAGMPATFFLTAGRLGDRREFWWDRLAHLLLAGDITADHIDVEVAGQRLWSDLRTEAGRERTHWALFWRLRPLPPRDIGEMLDQLETQLDRNLAPRASHRMMDVRELHHLAGHELFEIGAHSLTHPFLAAQPVHVQRDEIAQSKLVLERIIGSPVVSFAYPYGGPDALNDVTVDLVAEAGYVRACTATGRRLGGDVDPLRLPRQVVGNWSGDTLREQLDAWVSDTEADRPLPGSRRVRRRR